MEGIRKMLGWSIPFLILYLLAVYYILEYLILLIGSFLHKRKKSTLITNFETDKYCKFAILVCAHNEENVLLNSINSINNQIYPKEKFKLFLLLDNCTDNSELIVKDKPVHILKRKDPDNVGKGYAINYFFQQIKDVRDDFDAFIFFDADHAVCPTFLSYMNKYLLKKEKVLQGNIKSQNPEENEITKILDISNKFLEARQRTRCALNLSCCLISSCICVSKDILQKLQWQYSTIGIADDLEFHFRLFLLNQKVAFLEEAVSYEQLCTDKKFVQRQKRRFLEGRIKLSKKYFFPAVKNILHYFSLKKLEHFLFLAIPAFLSVIFIYFLSLNILSIIPFFLDLQIFLYVSISFLLIITLLSLIIISYNKIPIPLVLFFKFPSLLLIWIKSIFDIFLGKKNNQWEHIRHK